MCESVGIFFMFLASNFRLLLLSYYFTVEIFTTPIEIKLEIGDWLPATLLLQSGISRAESSKLVTAIVCMSF